MHQEKHLVMPLLFAAVFANLLLLSVTFTNASFSGSERTMPDFGISKVTAQLNNTIDTVQQNLVWAVGEATAIVKPQLVAFLGLEGYQYGAPRFSALLPSDNQVAVDQTIDASAGQVLGISIVNPLFGVQ